MKKNECINVTKTFLPPIRKYQKYIKKIWESNQLTNQGPILKQLESNLKKYLEVKYLHFVTNGTVALQLSLKALDIEDGEIITTPFSYVATTSSILWERCEPIFVDIEKNGFSIDPDKIEKAITKKTKAILAVHVFGFPCDIEKIAKIAKKYDLKVIYDSAHAFGSLYKGRPLPMYGDISICSFHSTKLFHTIEGGCVISKSKKVSEKLKLMKRFGHTGDIHYSLGINAKASEFQAAMGLCNLEYVDKIIKARKRICCLYDKFLNNIFTKPKARKGLSYNYAYYPIVFKSEKELRNVFKSLKKENIYPRRYFYPSLNTLPYLRKEQNCPVSESVSKRIACLPLYPGIKTEIVKKISAIIKSSL
ncbi:MAG: DegT/DnrJ/EryC1/StrS family aminotransferase [Parcubacteria group bacterium]|jgi:dTDP-4-amino-4,6-dideoxygalactose transaminase